MRKVLCDYSTVLWDPIYEDTECHECGHATEPRVVNEPAFHGPTVKRDGGYFCSRCGEQMVDLALVSAILMDRLMPKIAKAVNDDSPFYRYLKH